MNKSLKPFDIVFSGLKLGRHLYDFQIDDVFFSHFAPVEFRTPELQGALSLVKQNNLLELTFSLSGTVEVNCDITDLPFRMPIQQTLDMVVKFGEVFNDDDDEILILPQGEHTVSVAKYFYEMAVLGLPFKRVHPDVVAGKMGQEVLALMAQMHPDAEPEEIPEEETPTDPRWDKLKKFLNDN
jgi:uncharacterized metal-binding protein YceD (DUF177 family)